ncbi:MAG: amidohydrolase family protein, partial [Clostridiales bacterium]|nr:amidohydrolase family protein [Clostridiales bacterium]
PDTLSSDLHHGSSSGALGNSLNVLNRFLAMGMPLGEVIYRSTQRPAEVIGRPDLGTLLPGSCADIAVLDCRAGDFGFTDCGGARIAADHRLDCRMTIHNGNIVYNPNGIGQYDWQDAPQTYWQLPEAWRGFVF